MLSATNFLSMFILILVLVDYLWNRSKRKASDASSLSATPSGASSCTVPRGPRGHWLFGHTKLKPEELSPTIAGWSATHGPIFEAFLLPHGKSLGIFINDFEIIKGNFAHMTP